ncbi:MAG: 50S ribosomal protein L9 [Alphaproteobacteria bacterium]|nr:50S ribosomal protein L9 [Alphaproteobacteria bacterium]
MLVILKKEVQNLGDAGDIVRVKPGYGRNYLIPNGLAIPANESNVAELSHQKQMADAIRRKELSAAQELSKAIAETAITIRREAGEDDKLFGSVTNRDVVDALAEREISVDRRAVLLDEPIRAIGLFPVKIRLHREVTAELRVFVMRA